MSQKESQFKLEKTDNVTIATLFKFIKPFDGTREKLNSFLSNCSNAIELASEPQQEILFKFILSQLEGKAEIACSIKEFSSWDQLRDFLKTQFGERKHYAHLLTDLQECRQGISEPVSQFALRLETCLSKLLTEVTLSNKRKSELSGRVAAMEDLALHTFLLGLKPEISNLVRGKNPLNLNEAINLAIAEEKILNLFNKRNPSMSQRQSPKPFQISKPPNFNGNPRPQPQIQRPYNQSNQGLYCRYCKTQGHTIDTCKKREYNNNNRFKIPQPYFQQRPIQENFKPNPARVNCLVDENYTYDDFEPQPSSSTDYAQDNLNQNLNE